MLIEIYNISEEIQYRLVIDYNSDKYGVANRLNNIKNNKQIDKITLKGRNMRTFKLLKNIFSNLLLSLAFIAISNCAYCLSNVLSLTASSGNYSDETIIRLENQATYHFDGNWDAYKLPNGKIAPMLYTSFSGIDYSINSFPDDSNDLTIPLNFKAGFDGNYTITTKYLDSTFDTTYVVLIEDKLMNMTLNLRENNAYQFSATTADVQNRFAIHLVRVVPETNQGLISGVASQIKEMSFEVHVNQNGLTINLQDSQSDNVTIGIVNMEGKVIYEGENISASQIDIPLNNNGTGSVYIIRVISSNGMACKKIYF